MSSILKEAAMQRLVSLTKRTVAVNLARIDELLGEESRPIKPKKSTDVDRIARQAEAKQRYAKGRGRHG
jgi:methyl coenzyme M reductase beta subunit